MLMRNGYHAAAQAERRCVHKAEPPAHDPPLAILAPERPSTRSHAEMGMCRERNTIPVKLLHVNSVR
jgi:hypothetical protein